jgi:trehalose/maltose hydrolase-like predicted phosphorylase
MLIWRNQSKQSPKFLPNSMKPCFARLVWLVLCSVTPICKGAAPDPISNVWTIDSGEIDPKNYFGETVANGMIGLTTSTEPFRTAQAFINGAYESYAPLEPSCILSGLNFLQLDVSIDGVRIDRFELVKNFRQLMDFRQAAFTTTFDYEDRATVSYTLRALRHLPYSALLEVTVTARKPIVLSVASRIEVGTGGLIEPTPHKNRNSLGGGEGQGSKRFIQLAAMRAKGPSGIATVGAAQSYVFDENWRQAPEVTHYADGLAFAKEVAAGGSYHFSLVGSMLSSAQVIDPLNEAQRLTVAAVVQGTPTLVGAHERAWASLWESDLVIEGDDEAQRDLHGMLYHLYSMIREDSRLSIAPMGLSRGKSGYMGHIFWDAETWMMPTLLALHPGLAHTMLDYRFDRLGAAKRNALAHGYRGAKFPWESTATGDEDIWSSSPNGALEIHVTAAVASAAWNYYRVTRDRDWLREKGWPMIRETADFWTSRVTRNSPGHYDILHVTGFDEAVEDVTNNAYTNGAAKANLLIATETAKILGLAPDADWEHVRANIPLLRFPDGVIRQYEGYEGGKVAVSDAATLACFQQLALSPGEIRRELDFHESSLRAGTSGMGKAVPVILYARLGETEKAWEFFQSTLLRIKRPPFGVLAEYAHSKNPYFVTAAGALLQSVLYGFGGLEITDQGMVHKPGKLPAAWKSLTLTGIGPKRETFIVRRNPQ